MIDSPGKILIAFQEDVCVLKLVGDIRVTLCSSIDKTIENILRTGHQYRDVLINVMEAQAIDSTSLGLLAKLALYVKKQLGFKPTIVSTNPSITKLLNGVGFSQIFNILTSLDESSTKISCREFRLGDSFTEDEMRKKVIEAHKILMNLNTENQNAFRELVSNLEKDVR